VDLSNRPNRARLHQFDDPPIVVAGVDLSADLRCHFRLPCRFGNQAGLVDRVRQGLLAVTMLAHPHGHDARQGVRVVRRADDHGVDLTLDLLQHLAEIEKGLGPGELPASRTKLGLIDIAEGHDPLMLDTHQIGAAPMRHSNDCDPQQLVLADSADQGGYGPDNSSGRHGRLLQKPSATVAYRHNC